MQKKFDILIVDDDPQVHKIIAKMLPLEGYSVRSAYSADEALTSVARAKPDLIILDIMMPKVSGIEVCNKIKGNPETKDIMILILSAKDAQADRIEGLTHGADEYISKPFHMRHLMRKIEHMLAGKDEELKQ
ncbi:MAG: response regulator [Deltaproteobacteria bacterium]|nr:response regulator [Deltaproteobacteria bacterium]MBI2974940.1 response regulator [Deltaproteobacteria bacterium]